MDEKPGTKPVTNGNAAAIQDTVTASSGTLTVMPTPLVDSEVTLVIDCEPNDHVTVFEVRLWITGG